MSTTKTFLVERYMPGLGPADVELLARRLAAAAAQLRGEGRDVCWLHSVALPDDEACLCTFSAPTRSDVEEVNRRADARYERILETLTVDAHSAARTG